jgi:hypothetical protein
MSVVEMMETATPAAGEFLEILTVLVAVVGLWFHWGFMVARRIGGSIELAETPTNPIDINQPYLSARIGWIFIDYL